jgi:hypothetical protein
MGFCKTTILRVLGSVPSSNCIQMGERVCTVTVLELRYSGQYVLRAQRHGTCYLIREPWNDIEMAYTLCNLFTTWTVTVVSINNMFRMTSLFLCPVGYSSKNDITLLKVDYPKYKLNTEIIERFGDYSASLRRQHIFQPGPGGRCFQRAHLRCLQILPISPSHGSCKLGTAFWSVKN